MLLRLTGLFLVMGFIVTVPAEAVQKQGGKGKGDNTQIVEELHHVVKLLNEADRDYDGHRAKAVEEVHKAIKALDAKHKPPAVGTTTTPKPPPPKEEQEKSDKQLNAARDKLQTIQTKLAGMAGEHHKKAAADVGIAIQELNTALKIK